MGSDPLRSILEEAPFIRSRLPKTSLALRLKSRQIASAGFCITQITARSTPKKLRLAFSELLPHSLTLAGRSPELSVRLRNLLSRPDQLYNRLPLQTQGAIMDYLSSQNPTAASQTTQEPTTVSHTQSSPSTAPLSCPQPTPPNIQGASAAARTEVSPSMPQAVTTTQEPSTTFTFQTQPSPSTSQRGPTAQDTSSVSVSVPQMAPRPYPISSTSSELKPSSNAAQDTITAQVPVTTPESASSNSSHDPRRQRRRKRRKF